MKIAVVYYSRSGNTKKVAEAIAKAVGVNAQDITMPLNGQAPLDILFVGGAINGFDIEPELRTYLEGLSSNITKRVAVFGTAASRMSGQPKIKKLLEPKGIIVDDAYFQCFGKFLLLHPGRPNEADLKNAADFAKKAVG